MESMVSAQAIEILRAGQSLDGVQISVLDLRDLDADHIQVPVVIRQCRIGALDASYLTFHAALILEGNHIGAASFAAAYLLAGARFSDCVFTEDVTFDCGGHNRPPNTFLIVGCNFAGFVNFFDSWYPGQVEIRQCHFQAGTNLLGNVGQPFVTSFDVPPVIENNCGRLDMDGG